MYRRAARLFPGRTGRVTLHPLPLSPSSPAPVIPLIFDPHPAPLFFLLPLVPICLLSRLSPLVPAATKRLPFDAQVDKELSAELKGRVLSVAGDFFIYE